jgi:hypothetical protein
MIPKNLLSQYSSKLGQKCLLIYNNISLRFNADLFAIILSLNYKSKKLKLMHVSAALDYPQATAKLVKIVTLYLYCN